MKYQLLFLISCLLIQNQLSSQDNTIEYLSPMPEKVTNNAVSLAKIGNNSFLYSFAGMDSTKACGNAHLRCYRYDIQANSWQSLADLPQPVSGVVATGASTVKNKIYIFGGYHIRANCGEVTSGITNIFDPAVNDFVTPGKSMPIPVDDHVQAVWRDSLIYIITGWSNTTNVTNIQIYNPTEDKWTTGTPVPNSNNWKVFGASGTIIGDTIYYIGGAMPQCPSATNCFKPTNRLRKGVINPASPSEIVWSETTSDNAIGYRMAASDYQGNPIWIGGANNTYNFDGIAYDNSGGIQPNRAIKYYDHATHALIVNNDAFIPLMDFRGIAKITDNAYILAGGMGMDQIVSNQTIKMTISDLSSNRDINSQDLFKLFPNPANNILYTASEATFNYSILDSNGTLFSSGTSSNGEIEIDILNPGLYILKIMHENGKSYVSKFVKQTN